jgi:hypothetical protein
VYIYFIYTLDRVLVCLNKRCQQMTLYTNCGRKTVRARVSAQLNPNSRGISLFVEIASCVCVSRATVCVCEAKQANSTQHTFFAGRIIHDF